MSNQNSLNSLPDRITDFFMPDEDKIQLLKSILETERGAPVSLDEAEEVGVQLIAFFECLARDRTITPRNNGHEQSE